MLQRFSTDHYPYAVEAAADGNVYVSTWGSNTISMFRTQADGTLSYSGRLTVGPRPSALASSPDGSRLFAALAGTDQIAAVDTRSKKVLQYLRDEAPGAPSEGSTRTRSLFRRTAQSPTSPKQTITPSPFSMLLAESPSKQESDFGLRVVYPLTGIRLPSSK